MGRVKSLSVARESETEPANTGSVENVIENIHESSLFVSLNTPNSGSHSQKITIMIPIKTVILQTYTFEYPSTPQSMVTIEY